MKSCLIVDDSRTIRMAARKILQELGFQTAEAEDGQQALDACGKGMPDAVLLDWNMPVMNGLDFLKALRLANGGDRPVVVFCTTENSLERVCEALSAGANEFIMKPFDAELLEMKFSQLGLV